MSRGRIESSITPISASIRGANAEVLAYRAALLLLARMRCRGCGPAAEAVAESVADIATAALADGDRIRERTGDAVQRLLHTPSLRGAS